MGAVKNLTFKLFGDPTGANKAINSVGSNAARVGKRIALAAAAIAAAMTVMVVRFGVESVKAAADAETQQNKLVAAWEKFPKAADISLESLRHFNSALATKTKFDDDSIASGQAVLLNFKLTASQIQKVTPLLVDYAARTGKDLPTAAQDLGKALLGNARTLKALGIDFHATGDTTADFTTLMGLLNDKVGGFAEKEGTTAAGKLEILKNRFGEVQEAIGTALLPVLSDLIDFTNTTVLPGLESFSAWFSETGMPAIKDFANFLGTYKDDIIPGVIAALALWTTAQWALNVAMDANPIGAIILALEVAIAYIAALVTDFGGFRTTIVKFNIELLKGFASIILGVANAVQGAVNMVVDGLNFMLRPINAVLAALGQAQLSIPKANFASQMQTQYSNFTGGSTRLGVGGAGGGVHNIAGSFADGGIVPSRPGGWWANVAEGGQAEAIIPLDRMAGMGGGGTVINVSVPGFVGDENKLAQTIVRTLTRAQSRGAIPAGALSL